MMFEPGSMIGKYRIIRNLGAGGMADVYLVEDTTNRRQKALKVLPQEFAREPERAARFQKEVEHLSALEHPNIITVHDVGCDDGCHYYAMTYMTGGNLKQRIQQGMSINQAMAVLRQIADALHFAHTKGLIHRDIKPENILFDAKDQAVLTDLGIARAIGSRTRMTKTGMSIGTPHYMSPEQARGKDVDARSDIYSLGVVFYEMLTGNLPYDSEDTFAVAFKHVSDPLPELPQALAVYQPLIDRMMAKEQKGRFADASVLLAAVSHLEAGRTLKRPAAATRVMESPQEPKISRTKTEVRERIIEDYPTPQQKNSWVGKNAWTVVIFAFLVFFASGVVFNLNKEDIKESADVNKQEDRGKRYTGEKIALDVQGTNIRNVMRVLESVSGLKFVVSNEVSAYVTTDIQKPEPWDKILDMICLEHDLKAVRDGDNVIISYASTYSKIESLLEAVQRNPEDIIALYDLGNAYLNSGQPNKAIEAYQQALRIDREVADIWNNLGVAYGDSRQSNRAIEAYQQALSVDPDYVLSIYNLGMIYANIGDKQKAFKKCQILQRVGADRKYYIDILDHMLDGSTVFTYWREDGEIIHTNRMPPLGNLGEVKIQ